MLATEPTRMIDPPSFIRGKAFCTVNSVPFTLRSKSLSKCSSVRLARGANSPMPALATRISIFPFAFTVSQSRSRSCSLETSPRTPETLLPIAFTASSSSFWRRPVMKTYAPSLTNSFAAANPIPSVPPVMRAILSLSFLDIFFSVEPRNVLTKTALTGVEPLPNIRDGILVEGLVKTLRNIADMRRCQYVVQRPEGVRRRQRLNVEYVDRRAGDVLVRQRADQRLLVDDWPARRIDQPGRWLHSLQFRGPNQATGTAAQHQMDCQDVGPLEQVVLGHQDCAGGCGGLGRHVLAPGNQIHSE